MKKFYTLLCFLIGIEASDNRYISCLSEKAASLNAGVIMSLLIKHNQLHQKMIKEIESTATYTGIDHLSPKVLKALAQVPRHLFVRSDDEPFAYLNRPLPIGKGQTISQPFIVALMTELLDVQLNDKVLEIGTGSGYQAAILAQLAKEVYTIEIISSLADTAQKKFNELRYNNVHILKGNGAQGWVEHAPYSKIIITAAAKNVPYKLLEQLSNNGIMVLPLGKDIQYLSVIHKDKIGKVTYKSILPVQFVPFILP